MRLFLHIKTTIFNVKLYNIYAVYEELCFRTSMLELGYAAAILAWERVILVFNEKYGRPDDLPFDLRQHRLITYNSETESLATVRKSLSSELKSIIDDYFKSGPVLKKDMVLICKQQD